MWEVLIDPGGLQPVIAAEPGWVTLPAILPGPQPVGALTRELAAFARQCGLSWSVADIRHRLDDGGLTELVDEVLLAAPSPRRARLLIAIDQFEELLTQAGPAERVRFAALLRPALAGPVHVVATLRPEFLDQLLLCPELAELPKRVHPVEPLRKEALRSVIEGPARVAGINVDEDLVPRLVADTGSGGALPLLAYTSPNSPTVWAAAGGYSPADTSSWVGYKARWPARPMPPLPTQLLRAVAAATR
jgi:conflict system STAND superfamily ATPase